MYRSFLASANVWRPSGSAFTSSIIAFDGNGYLFVEELANVKAFTNTIRRVTITARNVGERDGLVLYAFDKSVRKEVGGIDKETKIPKCCDN